MHSMLMVTVAGAMLLFCLLHDRACRNLRYIFHGRVCARAGRQMLVQFHAILGGWSYLVGGKGVPQG